MKKLPVYIIFAILIAIGWTTCSQAMDLVPVTNFDSSWQIVPSGTGTATLTIDGSKLNLSAKGSATDYGENDLQESGTNGIIGMMATLQVDQATSPNDNCYLTVSKYIGQIGNSKIQAMIGLYQANNRNQIWYRVKGTDLTTSGKTVLMQGSFGDSYGGWTNGKSVTVAFALVGSEIWFYVVGSPGLIKFQILDGMIPYNGKPSINAMASSGCFISGSVTNTYLIHE
jgi:hypothetical protein